MFQAVRAEAVAEGDFGVTHDVLLNLVPIAPVVADFFAAGADGQQSAQDFHLGHGFIHADLQLALMRLKPADAELVGRRRQAGDQHQHQWQEPARLVKMRDEAEGVGRASFIPYAVVVAGDDLELVVAGRQAGVMGKPAGAGIEPAGVNAGEPVFEPHFFRGDVAQAGVMNFHLAGAGRNFRQLVDRLRLLVDPHAFDEHRRHAGIGGLGAGADFHNAAQGTEQQPARRIPRRRSAGCRPRATPSAGLRGSLRKRR